MVQQEGAMMIDVIPVEIRNWRLGRNRFQCGVRIDGSGGRIESWIRYSPLADLAVVIWNVFQEPFDRIIGVGALICIGIILLVCNVRSHMNELAFRHESAAHILIDEDESFLFKFLMWADLISVLVGPVRPDAVGRAQ
jgi:hypothetical protein